MCFYEFIGASTARNIPLIKLVVENKHLRTPYYREIKCSLNALDSGFIILDPRVEFLSVENLPTVVNFAWCTNLLNDFSYEICQTPVQAKIIVSPVMVTNNDLHILEEPFEEQNNI